MCKEIVTTKKIQCIHLKTFCSGCRLRYLTFHLFINITCPLQCFTATSCSSGHLSWIYELMSSPLGSGAHCSNRHVLFTLNCLNSETIQQFFPFSETYQVHWELKRLITGQSSVNDFPSPVMGSAKVPSTAYHNIHIDIQFEGSHRWPLGGLFKTFTLQVTVYQYTQTFNPYSLGVSFIIWIYRITLIFNR